MSPPSATATIADVPKLSLVPTRLTAQNCASASAQLTVKNAGTGTLHWSAKPASQTGYGIVPDHGALTAGRGQSITISNIARAGSIAFTSNGGNATVPVSCA